MKQIAKNELFKNLSGFLKSKGIELTDGSYSEGIRQSCSLLTDAINLGQESLEKAKTEIENSCEHIRRVVHEKTAPKRSPASPPPKTQRAAKPKGEKAPRAQPKSPRKQRRSAA